MKTLRSRRRAPLSGTCLPHFELIDAGAQIDYLLRAWPDPRLFRRVWSAPTWMETAPPRMDLEAWARGDAPWVQQPASRARRALDPRPWQLQLGLASDNAQVLSSGTAGFVATIPRDVRGIVAGFRLGQFPLLQLLAAHPAARDVALDSPVLVMALTDPVAFRGESLYDVPERTAALLRMRQRDALGWLGFPATNAARSVLRRVPRPAVSVDLLLRLRRVLSDQTVAPMLRHCPVVHAGVVELLASVSCRALVTPALVEEVASDAAELLHASAARQVENIATLASLLEGIELEPLRSRAALMETRARIEAAWERRAHRVTPAPPPPLPAPPARRAAPRARPAAPPAAALAGHRREETPATTYGGIRLAPPARELGLSAEPVNDVDELRAWARRQHNCCASPYYQRRLQDRVLTLYRLRMGPDEGTLSLVRHRGHWHGSELEGPHNTPPAAALRRAVIQWLGANFVKSPPHWRS